MSHSAGLRALCIVAAVTTAVVAPPTSLVAPPHALGQPERGERSDRGDLGDRDMVGPWGFHTRVVLSGASHGSEPDGYKVYSGVGVEAALVRRLTRSTAVELSVRTESREVDGPGRPEATERLGSIEMLPIALLVLWRPFGESSGRVAPYLGAGANVTSIWEKSGELDSADTGTTIGPLLALGAERRLTPSALLELSVRWNAATLEIEDFREPPPTIEIDPLAIGLGLGFRF